MCNIRCCSVYVCFCIHHMCLFNYIFIPRASLFSTWKCVYPTEILVKLSLHREWTSHTFPCKPCYDWESYTGSERSRRVIRLAPHPPSPIICDVRFSLITILTPTTRSIESNIPFSRRSMRIPYVLGLNWLVLLKKTVF